MLSNWEYQLPTRIQFGCGSLTRLGETAGSFGKSVLLAGYCDRTGLEDVYAKAAKSLTDAGLRVTEFCEVPPDPDAELGDVGAEVARRVDADVIIGLGGGSVLDASKGFAVLARMSGCLWDYTTANEAHQPVTDAIPVIAVPTTAGTGSEVTPVAVFTHRGVGAEPDVPLKASISSPWIRPKVALIDPELAVGSPSRLTAACGADALGHAIEACMSRKANPFSTALASRAVRLIVKNLARAVEKPEDPEPREPLALGAVMAGAAFGMAGVVMTHAIAQAMGSLLHIPHGEAVAMATPANLRYSVREAQSVYCQLAHYCGVTADSSELQAARFVESITDLLRSVGIRDQVQVPDSPDASTGGATWTSRDDLAEKLTRNAFASTPVPLTLNPRPVDHDSLKEIFLKLLASSETV